MLPAKPVWRKAAGTAPRVKAAGKQPGDLRRYRILSDSRAGTPGGVKALAAKKRHRLIRQQSQFRSLGAPASPGHSTAPQQGVARTASGRQEAAAASSAYSAHQLSVARRNSRCAVCRPHFYVRLLCSETSGHTGNAGCTQKVHFVMMKCAFCIWVCLQMWFLRVVGVLVCLVRGYAI